MAGSLQKTGVEAVVEGLGSFKSQVGELNSSIGSIGGQGNFLTRALGGAWEMLKGFGESAIHIAEYALGALLADAIEFVITKLRELAMETIEAGSQFQIMQLRLKQLNFNDAIESGMDYEAAMADATKATQEQLEWIQKLAVQTPYDAQDIANVFTLAKSYGFASETAQALTVDIADFAAGMGLGNTEIERIIVNFGQMQQQGKVTGREMTDLARGAFVPVNDILEQMKENTGLTGAEFEKFRNTGEGVNEFLKAFSQIVKERFEGAAANMARTFNGATDNAKDFVKSLIGFGVVTPILNVLGGKLADLLNTLTTGSLFDKLTLSAKLLGDSLSGLLGDILDLFLVFNQPAPTLFDDLEGGLKHNEEAVSGIGEKIVEVLSNIRVWVDENKDKILQFFTDFIAKAKEIWTALKNKDFKGFLEALGLNDKAIGKIVKLKDDIVKAFETIKAWVDSNGPLIEKFFTTLGEIVGEVFKNLTGGMPEGGGLEGFLGGVTAFMQYVVENKSAIADFVTKLIELWAVLQVVGAILAIIIPPIVAILGFIIAVAGAIVLLSSAWSALTAIVAFFATPVGFVILAVIAVIAVLAALAAGFWYVKDTFMQLVFIVQVGAQMLKDWVVTKFTELKEMVVAKFTELKDQVIAKFQELWTGAKQKLVEMVQGVMEKVDNIISTFTDVDWGGIGWSIIEGVKEGIISAAEGLIDELVSIVQGLYEAAMGAIGAASPSKLFMDIGKFSMLGIAEGLARYAGVAENAMAEAVSQIAMPAMNMSLAGAALGGGGTSVSNTNSTTNNLGLTINSSARVEPILQDYNMMKSLIGA